MNKLFGGVKSYLLNKHITKIIKAGKKKIFYKIQKIIKLLNKPY